MVRVARSNDGEREAPGGRRPEPRHAHPQRRGQRGRREVRRWREKLGCTNVRIVVVERQRVPTVAPVIRVPVRPERGGGRDRGREADQKQTGDCDDDAAYPLQQRGANRCHFSRHGGEQRDRHDDDDDAARVFFLLAGFLQASKKHRLALIPN